MFVIVEEADLTGFWEEELSRNINKAITCGITEEHSRTNRKHVWFFEYKLRMGRGTVLILTWLSAQCQYL